MAIENTLPMLFSEIIAEFGGDPPHLFSEYYKNGGIVDSDDIAPNVPASGPMLMSQFLGAARNEIGQIEYTVPGRYTFTVPDGVRSVCAVCVGGGGSAAARGGGGGGALSWTNNIPVTTGEVLEVEVAAGGADSAYTSGLIANGSRGGNSSFGSIQLYNKVWTSLPSSSAGLTWNYDLGSTATNAVWTSAAVNIKGMIKLGFYHDEYSAISSSYALVDRNGYRIQHSINNAAWVDVGIAYSAGQESRYFNEEFFSYNYGTSVVTVKYRIIPYDRAGSTIYMRIGAIRLDIHRYCAAQGGAHSTNNQDTGGLGGVKIIAGGGGDGGKGGNAASGRGAGGGGAGGYSGKGGAGSDYSFGVRDAAEDGAGGGGGGGWTDGQQLDGGSGGGGVGIYGEGNNGAGGLWSGGGGGSGGADGEDRVGGGLQGGANGGVYGGGAGGNGENISSIRYGGNGAVRVIWGFDRAYPATRTANEVGA